MRRSFVSVGLALLVGATIVQAQSQQQEPAAPPASQTPAAAAAAPAQAPPDALRFTTPDAALVMQVLPGKSADFEAAYTQMIAALTSSAKPGMKEFGSSMKLYKVNAGTPADQPSLYLVLVTGVSKDLSYHFGKILYYSGKDPGEKYDGVFEKQEDATAVYNKIKDSLAPNGINPWPLQKIGG